MAIRTSAEAQKRVCWKGLEMGDHFYCYGDECTAWVEVAFDKAHDGDDITPKGECGLLMALMASPGEE